MKTNIIKVLSCLLIAVSATAQVIIDRRVTVQPIFLTYGGATPNPSQVLFEAETDKIWSQAGIDIAFNAPIFYELTPSMVSAGYYNSGTGLINVNSGYTVNNLSNLTSMSGVPWSTSNLDSNVIRVFFTQTIDNGTSNIAYSAQSFLNETVDGTVFSQQNGIVIQNAAFSYSSGSGIRDIVAHELGHNLGLGISHQDENYVSHTANNLMAAGNVRTLPTTISNIYPDGLDCSQLTPQQISIARMAPVAQSITPYTYSPSAVPEPEHYAAVMGACGLMAAWVRRRKSIAKNDK